MFSSRIQLSGCLTLVAFCGYASAALNGACSTDTDCTSENANCISVFGCSSKGCSQCATNYVYSSGSCLKDYDQSCTADGDCATGTCSTTTSKCACADTHTWNDDYKACVTTNKEFGHECGTPAVDTDCEVISANHGECIEVKCDCENGYIKAKGHICRQPYLGENGCTATPGCQKRTSDGSEAVPDCTNSACVCPSSAPSQSVMLMGESVNICITTVTTNQKGSSLECTNHNDCESNLCYSCPGTPAAKVCVDRTAAANNNEATQTAIGSLMMLAVSALTGLLL